jgi:hypothetical protein
MGLSAPLFAASALDSLPENFVQDRAQVHAIVTALEEQPLHENADLARVTLHDHYKDVDYTICGDLLSPLAKDMDATRVMMQMIIASGDWVEAHPDDAKNFDAYTLAGVESGMRAYRNLVAAKPKAKNKMMEEIVQAADANTLPAWISAHACVKK